MDVPGKRRKQVKTYYLQDDIVDEMTRIAAYREFAPTYPTGYGSRPDAVNFPGDFRGFVEDGAIAFHGSVERWRNPHLIDQVDADDLRTGWDLVIDIDCDADLVFAKIAAAAILDTLDEYGVEGVSVKFSGNRGFHIGVPGTAFPGRVQGTDHAAWYPDLPQTIVSYLRNELRDELSRRFVDADNAVKDVVYEDGEPTPYDLCDIENNWGDRHLFRLPYSVNEKSWLVSLPLPATQDTVMAFEKPDAEIDTVQVEHRFLDADGNGSGTELAVDALDWRGEQDIDRTKRVDGDFSIPDTAIPEEDFPPTIRNILEGLKDGRKRALFILVTFLQHVGYDWNSIEQAIWEWNDRNHEPLDETYVTAQLNWHKRQDEPLMPPNFDANGFYKDIGVYEEDPLTENVANPVSYAFAKVKERREQRTKKNGKQRKQPEHECPYCGKEYVQEPAFKKHVQECFE